ncbi:MAG TPA: alanine racemase [Thermomicrobiaceae bacterium]|nr:alanine racemase [Thermomicrobiaceae bacterium]
MPDPFAERLAAARAATHALIDLDALAGNVTAVRARLPDGVALMAVVKANAYGHGLVPCARQALAAGATCLAVARVDEGLLLRAADVSAPLLALGPANPALASAAARGGIAVAVGSLAGLRALQGALRPADPALAVHLKLDTGMHRFGIEPAGALDLARAVLADGRLRLDGLFTHFATADEAGDAFLQEQARCFAEARHALAAAGIAPPQVHVANSAATLRGLLQPGGDLPGRTLVRAGLLLYGLAPSPEVPAPPEFRPVMTLVTPAARVFTLPAGEGVSYGLTFTADRPLRCATLPIGYGDGLSRALSNRGWVAFAGARCPVRGRVCMDQTVVEVEAAPAVTEGDVAVVLGPTPAMSADDAARLAGTINYEVVTALAARVPRVYLRAGRPVALSDLAGSLAATAG